MSVAQTGKTMTVMEKVGPNIISHVSNSDITHPVIELPSFFGINFSITKHVVMLWNCFNYFITNNYYSSKNILK